MTPEGLVLPFDTDDPEFVRGVELGMLYERICLMPGGVEQWSCQIHTSNLEMALRIVEASPRWAMRTEAVTDEEGRAYDDWTRCVFTAAEL